MTNKYKVMKEKLKNKAKNDILEFMNLAKDSFKSDKKKSNMYVRKARRLAMKHRIKLPVSIKRRICKNCYSYIVPGVNCRVRTREGKLIYYCLECKRYMRMPLR